MEVIIATGDVHGELLGDPSTEVRANIGHDGPVQRCTLYQLAARRSPLAARRPPT